MGPITSRPRRLGRGHDREYNIARFTTTHLTEHRAAKQTRLGEVEAADEREAVEKAGQGVRAARDEADRCAAAIGRRYSRLCARPVPRRHGAFLGNLFVHPICVPDCLLKSRLLVWRKLALIFGHPTCKTSIDGLKRLKQRHRQIVGISPRYRGGLVLIEAAFAHQRHSGCP
jgi:hypothetical protein